MMQHRAPSTNIARMEGSGGCDDVTMFVEYMPVTNQKPEEDSSENKILMKSNFLSKHKLRQVPRLFPCNFEKVSTQLHNSTRQSSANS